MLQHLYKIIGCWRKWTQARVVEGKQMLKEYRWGKSAPVHTTLCKYIYKLSRSNFICTAIIKMGKILPRHSPVPKYWKLFSSLSGFLSQLEVFIVIKQKYKGNKKSLTLWTNIEIHLWVHEYPTKKNTNKNCPPIYRLLIKCTAKETFVPEGSFQ